VALTKGNWPDFFEFEKAPPGRVDRGPGSEPIHLRRKAPSVQSDHHGRDAERLPRRREREPPAPHSTSLRWIR